MGLQEIKKHTEASHADFPDLEEALQKINMVVTVVNEATRHAEMVHKMLQLQSKFSEVPVAQPATCRSAGGGFFGGRQCRSPAVPRALRT